MWNPPSAELLRQVPKLRATENVLAKERIISLHFFIGACDWYAAEFDGDDLFFGFAVLNDDMPNAEWGYFALSELQDICISGIEIDHDIYWEPTPAGAIERIKDWI